jgi:hemerythrin superfamily protein
VAKETGPDVIQLLVGQHQEIKKLFDQVARASGERKRGLFDELVRLLAVHEAAEEEVVHPIVRHEVHGAGGVVDARLTEENAAKEALAKLYDLGVEHAEFDTRLDALARSVTEHADREENEEFPPLRATVSPEKLRQMAGAVRLVESTAPTRPHPDAGESATAQLLGGPPLSVFDRARDAVRDWRRAHNFD